MKISITLMILIYAVNAHGLNSSLENFKKTIIKIDKVPYDLYEGTVTVRLNRSDSDSKCFLLPVHILKSTSPYPAEPIFGMTGGPGNANLRDIPPIVFLANHDIVLVGYRGVDGPVMPASKKLTKALRGYDHQLLSNESLDRLGSEVNEYFSELVVDGIDINHFTILDVVDDFEDV